jgi:predicted dehydrogenase
VLRGGFIGFGNVAEAGHAPGWQACPDARIVAAVDGVPERRVRFEAAFPQARFYADAAAMLEAETLDFVDICTPPGDHTASIAQAQAAGLHVLCEKPTVTRAADLEPLAEASRRRGLALHTVHNWLKAPIARQITALVDRGAVGPVRSVRWETLRTQPAVSVPSRAEANWRTDPAHAGGGILVDHGWHAFYCVARWAGGQAQTVAASLEQRKWTDWSLEDTATVEIDFGEVAASVFLTWAADERANRIAIEGPRGSISVSGAAVVLETDEGSQAFDCPPALSEGSHHPDRFGGVRDDFLAAIKDQGADNLDEAILCARLIDGAQASDAGNGSAVVIAGEVGSGG